jgi:hypothetical protein
MSAALKGVGVAEIPNQPGPTASVGGFLSNLFGGNGGNAPPPGRPRGYQGQNSRRVPTENPQSENQSIPEEEPTPEYNAPPSFWDRLLGQGRR